MILVLLALASAASPDNCQLSEVVNIRRDSNAAEPFVLATTGGEYRLMGQDFINPREWHSGDKLEVCALPGPGKQAKIVDIVRSETMMGQLIVKDAQAPAAER